MYLLELSPKDCKSECQILDPLKKVEVDVNNICTDTQDNLNYYPIDPNLNNQEDLRPAIPGGGDKLTGGDPNVLF